MQVCQVREQLRSLYGMKLTGKDQIPLTLVLLAADELAVPLRDAINYSIRDYTGCLKKIVRRLIKYKKITIR